MPPHAADQRLSHDEVIRLCGDLQDATVQAIVDSGATVPDLEIALAWAGGEDDVMGEERKPLEGIPAAVYDILTRDPEFGEFEVDR
jgi:hypothetical protein